MGGEMDVEQAMEDAESKLAGEAESGKKRAAKRARAGHRCSRPWARSFETAVQLTGVGV